MGTPRRPRLRVIPRGPWAREGNVSSGVPQLPAAVCPSDNSLLLIGRRPRNVERCFSLVSRASVSILGRACGTIRPLSFPTIASQEHMNDSHGSQVAAYHHLLGSEPAPDFKCSRGDALHHRNRTARCWRRPLAPSPFARNRPPGEIAVGSL